MKNISLVDMRNSKGFTQEYMAEKLNISIVAYHLYETGQRKIPKNKAEIIANILEVKLTDIFLPSTFSLR